MQRKASRSTSWSSVDTVVHWSEAELRAEQEQSKAGAPHKCTRKQAGAEEHKLEHGSTSSHEQSRAGASSTQLHIGVKLRAWWQQTHRSSRAE